MQIQVALIDHDTNTDPAEVAAVAAALTIQATRDFAPFWGVEATVRVDTALKPGDWAMYLLANPDQPGALGDHDETPDGKPLGRVFSLLDKKDGIKWSTTASHELAEMLADPYLSRATQMPSGKFLALEACDAVEDDTYLINGVEVSNFCTPAWFEPPKHVTQYDYLKLLRKPYTLRPGGYMQVWDGQRWSEQTRGTRRERHRTRGLHRNRRAFIGI